MNNKFLPKFETWIRPLIVDFFMPKFERKNLFSKMNQFGQFPGMPNQKMPVFNPSLYPQNPYNIVNQMSNFGINPNMIPKHMMHPQMYNPNAIKNPYNHKQKVNKSNNQKQLNQQVNQTQPQTQQPIQKDDIDYNYLSSLEDDYAKKDYLGEHIFKKIENHKFSQMKNFTIDTIGKITGMILGIEDIQEIIDICRTPEFLTSRITEALELLEGQGQL